MSTSMFNKSGQKFIARNRAPRVQIEYDVEIYLFGLVMEHYLARHVAINVFTETSLHSMQRGEVARWPVRMGTRGMV